jgi:hypothetical protein
MKNIDWTSRQNRWSSEERQAIAASHGFKKSEFLKSLKKEEDELLSVPQTTKKLTEKIGHIPLISLRLYIIQKLSETASGSPSDRKKFSLTENIRKFSVSETLCKKLGIKLCKRGNDWSLKSTIGKTEYFYSPNDTIIIRSFGIVTKNGKILLLGLHEDDKKIIAPEGYLWGFDSNGIKIFKTDSIRDDYHPDADDFYYLQIDGIVKKLEQKRLKRLEIEAKEK